ncbi:HIT-type Zinc finger family protein [Hibiscus syriacus]|uniref:HIT-type Zinc finger family protein n=1 Tax=Hibiscus syriacus TaxID=106335 RepID=A0A6A2YPS5_HIBSY|nr:HIT-type Zinc finger family protein [Hibiscus syriacus]
MVDVADKLAYFQTITGLEDPDLCTEILQAHGWDLELAISSFTSSTQPSASTATPDSLPLDSRTRTESASASGAVIAPQPGLAWKLITLPISVISGSLGLISGAVGLGLWVAGGVLSYSLGMIRVGSGQGGESSTGLVSVSSAASEAMDFVAAFDREYGTRGRFLSARVLWTLCRDSPDFCQRTLCSETLAAFVNENFVAWGGSIRSSEGFKMSNSLKASRFPFCAVVMPATNQRIALLQQTGCRREKKQHEIKGRSKMPLIEQHLKPIRLGNAKGERSKNVRKGKLRKLSGNARKKKRLVKEKYVKLLKRRRLPELECGRIKPCHLVMNLRKDLMLHRFWYAFQNGERKERRFPSTAPIQSLYDYVDSLGCLEVEDYNLVSNFPRVTYGIEKLSLTLKEVGLHPQGKPFCGAKLIWRR